MFAGLPEPVPYRSDQGNLTGLGSRCGEGRPLPSPSLLFPLDEVTLSGHPRTIPASAYFGVAVEVLDGVAARSADLRNR